MHGRGYAARVTHARHPAHGSSADTALERRFALIDRHRFHGILVTLWLRR
jgi:hypothetical protein